METNMIIFLIVVVVIIWWFFIKQDEHFYFKSPPLTYDADACSRLADNTFGANSYYYDPITRQCWLNSYYKYGDLMYPYMNNTYFWSPTKYRWGRTWVDREGNYRPRALQVRTK